MARVGAGVSVWPAVLGCASWSWPGRPVGQELVFHCVGNGAEPQPGPGLMEGWRGSQTHLHQFLVTACT